MEIPTDKPLLDRIKAGDVGVGLIPCPPDHIPVPGDRVVFREATFSFGRTTVDPVGDSIQATLTVVYDTGDKYQGSPLCTLRWEITPAPKPLIPPGYENLFQQMLEGWHLLVRNLLSCGLGASTVRTALKEVVVKQIKAIDMDAHGEELFFSLAVNSIEEVIEEELKGSTS